MGEGQEGETCTASKITGDGIGRVRYLAPAARHLCSYVSVHHQSSVGAAYSLDVAPDGAKNSFAAIFYKYVAPLALLKRISNLQQFNLLVLCGAASPKILSRRQLDPRQGGLKCPKQIFFLPDDGVRRGKFLFQGEP